MNQEQGFETGQVFDMKKTVEYADGSIVSRQLIKKDNGNITLFAFDKGEELSEHTSPYDALIQVLEGQVRITIGGKDFLLDAQQSIIMPADIPHALFAPERMKMLLIMIR
jgi:quercetin dioxygenase-like cupin family protein